MNSGGFHCTFHSLHTMAFVLCLVVWATTGLPGEEASVPTQPPNVIVFLADDAGWGDYGHNGNQTAHTPNIDRLATEGASFDRFFVCPVCAPTRAEFLTGRYHPRTGVSGVSTGQERMSLREKTIADALRSRGYATGAFGKWHNGSQWPYHPMARGFEEYYGYTSGHWGEYFDPPLEHQGKPIREKGYIVDRCTDKAIDFIERNRDKPFFCYIPFTTPHSPWSVPEEYWNKYRDRSIAQPATMASREVPEETRCVMAMLENQDWNVGRVLAKIDALNLASNTIVVYFSDNGPNGSRWNGGMKGTKGTTDEGGVRSTCLIRYPKKVPAGKKIETIAGAIDWMPTLLALTQTKRVGELPLDGMDLSRLLLADATELAEGSAPTSEQLAGRMLFQMWNRNVSVRTQTHRLDAQGHLYDMITDPAQARPIESEQPEIARKLQDSVQVWRREVQAEFDSQVPRTIVPLTKQVDPRPIPVGFSEFPRTWLPARDASFTGAIERSANAPNSSYFVRWSTKEDRIEWEIEVEKSGNYTVQVDYTCPASSIGAEIELTFLQSRLTKKIDQAWDPPLYTHQDTIPRPKNESKMKEFRRMEFGSLWLEKGRGPLRLQATTIPAQTVLDLSSLTLVLQ